MKIREHPLTVIKQAFKVLLLLGAAVIRNNAPEIIAAAFLASAYAVFAYLNRSITLKNREIIRNSGVIIKRRISAKTENITAVCSRKLLGIVKVTLCFGGNLKTELYLTGKGYGRLRGGLLTTEFSRVKKCSFSHTFKMSFFLANPLGGLLIAAAFFIGLYKTLGAIFMRSIASALLEIGQMFKIYEAPFYVIVASLTALSWAVSLAVSVVKYSGFTESEGHDFRKISFGALLKYEYFLKNGAFLCDARIHTLMSYIFSEHFDLKIYEGFGKKENFYPVTVFADLPGDTERCFRPRKRSYLYKPLSALFGLSLCYFFLPRSYLVPLFFIILIIVLLRYLILSVSAAFFSGISVNETGVFVKTIKKSVFYETFLTFDKIAAVETERVAFFPRGSVTVTVRTKGGNGTDFKIKHFSKRSAEEILKKIKNYSCKTSINIV